MTESLENTIMNILYDFLGSEDGDWLADMFLHIRVSQSGIKTTKKELIETLKRMKDEGKLEIKIVSFIDKTAEVLPDGTKESTWYRVGKDYRVV